MVVNPPGGDRSGDVIGAGWAHAPAGARSSTAASSMRTSMAPDPPQFAGGSGNEVVLAMVLGEKSGGAVARTAIRCRAAARGGARKGGSLKPAKLLPGEFRLNRSRN